MIIELNVPPETAENIKRLQQVSGVETLAELFSRSLALYEASMKLAINGSKFVVLHPDGTVQDIVWRT